MTLTGSTEKNSANTTTARDHDGERANACLDVMADFIGNDLAANLKRPGFGDRR